MASTSQLSQSFSVDDDTTVDPLRDCIANIMQEIDDDDCRKLFFLMKDNLGGQYDEISAKEDRWKFFTTLEEKFGREKAIQAFKNALIAAHLHDEDGNSLAGHIDSCLEKSSQQQCFFGSDCIGRKAILSNVVQSLREYKGVIVSGLSGMGKSSLAKMAARTLTSSSSSTKDSSPGSKYKWRITYINQRGKTDLKDLVLDIVTELRKVQQENIAFMDTLELSELRSYMLQLLGYPETILPKNQLLLLDNLDGHFDTREKKDGLIQLVSMILDLLETTSSAPITRLLLTVSPMLSSVYDTKTNVQNKRFDGQMMEYNLGLLCDTDAADVLRASSTDLTLPDIDCSNLNKFCQGYPMALKIVGQMLNDGYSVSEVLLQLGANKLAVSSAPVEACLQRSIEQLTTDKSTAHLCGLLVKLTVFQSAIFDLSAAVMVTYGQSGMEKQGHGSQSPNKDILKCNLKILQKHHLLEIEQEYESSAVKDKYLTYSLHPLVCQYLQLLLEREKDLQSVHAEAKLNFAQYFLGMIVEYGTASDETPLKIKVKIDNDKVHLRRLFTLVLDENLDISELYEKKRSKKRKPSTISVYRNMWKVARLLLLPRERIRFCKSQIKLARKGGKFYEYLFWKALKCEDYLALDRLEKADTTLKKVHEELCSGSWPEHSEQTRDVDINILQKQELEIDLEYVPAVAKYYEMKGRVFHYKKMFKEALESLSVAEKLYNRQPVPNLVVKNDKQKARLMSNRHDYARLLNLFGCVYFEQKDLPKAMDYHKRAYEKLQNDGVSFWHEDKTEFQHNIASIHHQLALGTKDEDKKKKYFREALKQYSFCVQENKKVGRNISTQQAITLRARSDIFYKQQEFENALHDAKDSSEILQKLLQPPHVDLTRACAKMAFSHWKLAKKKEADLDSVGSQHHFETCLNLCDDLLKNYFLQGGLPGIHLLGDDNKNSVLYRDIKKKHMKVMDVCKCGSAKQQRTKRLYQEFEQGFYDKKIQEKRSRITGSFHEEMAKLRAAGQPVTLVPCSDDSDSESESSDSSGTGTSQSSSSSSCALSRATSTEYDGNQMREAEVEHTEMESEATTDTEYQNKSSYSHLPDLGICSENSGSLNDEQVQMRRARLMKQPSVHDRHQILDHGEDFSLTAMETGERGSAGKRLSSGYWSTESDPYDRKSVGSVRRESWLGSSGSNSWGSGDTNMRRKQWGSSDSQSSVSSKFEMLLTLESLNEEQEGPVTKKLKK